MHKTGRIDRSRVQRDTGETIYDRRFFKDYLQLYQRLIVILKQKLWFTKGLKVSRKELVFKSCNFF